MKRENSNQENFATSGSSSSSNKGKMWCEEQDAGGVDELFAVLGYKVKSSDMAEVAQKLEHLEEVMGSVQQDGLSQIASDTVHYNPSDLSSWLESMISELNPLPNFESFNSIVQDPFLETSCVTSIDSHSYNSLNSHARSHISVSTQQQMVVDSDFGSDLISIPGKAVYPPSQQHPPLQHQPQPKKLKPSSYSGMGSSNTASWGSPNESISAHPIESARPMLLVDSQENGIRLVHSLMACAEAVQHENLKLAEALVKQVTLLAVSQAGAMRKVATYFKGDKICTL
ncbi:DELLA protein GAI1-like [Olea europaea var. sylvestris]|uniref:DELLA protein GAI1-like n=1 Tax=Olea europaea var. sylvestris TaxID=158386 RepID=UPI000C1D25C2|nr:DELLA protein GAI1-like [Olea europaea var. sylvestris]